MILKKKKIYTFFVVPKCYRTPIPKCHALMLPFYLSQGLSKCWLSVTLKWAKHFFKINIKNCTWNKICSLACLKAKTDEKPRTSYFSLVQIKNCLTHFFRRKKMKQTLISNFFLRLFFALKGRILQVKNINI